MDNGTIIVETGAEINVDGVGDDVKLSDNSQFYEADDFSSGDSVEVSGTEVRAALLNSAIGSTTAPSSITGTNNSIAISDSASLTAEDSNNSIEVQGSGVSVSVSGGTGGRRRTTQWRQSTVRTTSVS